jgi:hypothetical protein
MSMKDVKTMLSLLIGVSVFATGMGLTMAFGCSRSSACRSSSSASAC